MASITKVREPFVPGSDWRAIVTWKGDASYAAGGEALTLRECGFGPEAVFSYANVLFVKNLSEQAVLRPTAAHFDGTKVHLFDAATGKELAGGSDTSKVEVGLEIVCSSR